MTETFQMSWSSNGGWFGCRYKVPKLTSSIDITIHISLKIVVKLSIKSVIPIQLVFSILLSAYYSSNHHLNEVERFEWPHESQELCCLEPCAPVGSPMANWSRRREQTKNGSRAVRSCAPQSLNTRGAWRTTKTILINLTNKLLPFHKH